MSRLIMVFVGIVFFSLNGTGTAYVKSIEVTLFGTVNNSLHMVFDLEGDEKLCSMIENAVELKKPTQALNPGTFMHSGGFYINTDAGGKQTTQYGKISYQDAKLPDGEVTLFTFRRNGGGEKSLASDFEGRIWAIGPDNALLQVASMEYRTVTLPDGEQRTLLMQKGMNSKSVWIGESGGKIYQENDNGALSQIGWVGWRMADLGDDKQIVMLMTKAMAKSSKWTGRFQGQRYQGK